jgi:ABC-type multidrug transport system ATPase subunit
MILQIDKISFNYKKRQILKEICLNVPKASIYALLGENGAGKSTLIKILLGVLVPDSGSIYYQKSIFNEFTRINHLRRIGSLIENASLYDYLTAYENLELARKIYGIEKGYSEEVLNIVGLKEMRNQKVKTFSMGMKQRLGIGLSMIGKPELIILDEPSNGLDPSGIVDLRNLIIKLNNDLGTSFFISSHQLSEIEKIATNVAILHNGQIKLDVSISNLEKGTLDEIYLKIVKGV